MSADAQDLSLHYDSGRVGYFVLRNLASLFFGLPLFAMGLVLFVYVLFAIAFGETSYNAMQNFMSFWLFKLVYWGFIYALFFHLVHGIRHLIWDIGKTFDKATLDKYAVYELAAGGALTLLTFLLSRG